MREMFKLFSSRGMFGEFAENPTNAHPDTLLAIERNRYMDDLLLSSDSLTDLGTLSEESVRLFERRGFKLHKWVANEQSKSILLKVPQCDLRTNIREIDFVAKPMPDSTALGLLWDIENDTLSAK